MKHVCIFDIYRSFPMIWEGKKVTGMEVYRPLGKKK